MPGQGTVIDELVVTLGLDPTQFNTERKNAARDLLGFKQQAKDTAKAVEGDGKKMTEAFGALQKRLLGVAALFLGGMGLKQFAEQVTKVTANTGRMATQLGLTTTELDTWAEMGKRVGASGDEIVGSIANLTSQLEHFRITGQGQIVPLFNRMGISLLDVNGKAKSTTQLLREMATWAQGKDAKLVTQWFKEMGMSPGMINLLLKGPDAIDKMTKSIHEIGTATDKDAEAAKKLQEQWAALEQRATTLGRALMTILTPALTTVMSLIEKFLTPATTADKDGNIISSGQVDALGNVVGNEVDAYGKPLHKGGPVGPGIAPSTGGPASTSAPSGGAKVRPMGQTESDVSYLMGLGWSREQAIGIAANIHHESGGRLNATGDGGRAFGLAQWHPDRQRAFRLWAGHDIRQSTRAEQLAFIDYELRQGSEQAAGRALKRARTPGQAAAIVSARYERPAGGYFEARKRAASAERMAKTIPELPLGGLTQVSPPNKSFSDALRTLPNPGTSTAAILNAANRNNVSNVTTSHQASIGEIHVHTSATDGEGIARDLKPALQRSLLANQANYGQN